MFIYSQTMRNLLNILIQQIILKFIILYTRFNYFNLLFLATCYSNIFSILTLNNHLANYLRIYLYFSFIKKIVFFNQIGILCLLNKISNIKQSDQLYVNISIYSFKYKNSFLIKYKFYVY